MPRHENDTAAQDTIRILNLNDERSLHRERRREIIETVINLMKECSAQDFLAWIERELDRQPDGTFKSFWTTRKYAANLYS